MKKKRVTRNFILLAILLLIGLVFTVFSFDIPTTNYTFKGFARAIQTGMDFGDGSSAVFTVERLEESKFSENEYLEKTAKHIQDMIYEKYSDGRAYVVDNNKICIEVPDAAIPQELAIGNLEMKTTAEASAETYLTGADIKSAEYRMTNSTHGVYIEFTKAGKEKFADFTQTAVEGNGTIYFILNQEYKTAQGITIEEAMKDGYAYISMGTKEAAKIYAERLENSKLGVNLTIEGDVNTIYSNFNTYQKVVAAIVMVGLVVGSIIFLIVRYKRMGLVGGLLMGYIAVITTIILSLFEKFRLTLGSYLGMALGYLLTFLTLVITIEKCKSEFESGKKLNASFKAGYLKSLGINIDIYVISAVVSIITLLLTKGFLNGFASSMLANICIGAFMVLLTFRWFIAMYVKINSTKPALVGFNAPQKKVEEKEEAENENN